MASTHQPRSTPGPAVLPFAASLADAGLDLAGIGAPAAAAADIARHGLPVLPGFVVTPAGVAALTCGIDDVAELLRQVHVQVGLLGELGYRTIAITASTDGAPAPARSVVLRVDDVEGLIRAVLDLARGLRPVDEMSPAGGSLLVQAHPTCVARGVALGADPWTGRGRPVAFAGAALTRGDRRRVARAVRLAGRAYGAPQDVDLLVDVRGRVWLVATRPLLCWARLAGQLDGESP